MRAFAQPVRTSDLAVVMSEKRPKIQAIASLAGVSVATVDRVLSNRAKVSHASTLKVLAALNEMGASGPLPSGARGTFRFDVVLALEDESFFERYRTAFCESAAAHGVQVRTARVPHPDSTAADVFDTVEKLGERRHGLVLTGKESELMRTQIERLESRGIPTMLLVSPVSQVSAGLGSYVGIDNYVAGRTAGYLLGSAMGGHGTIVLITNALEYQSHTQRTQGLKDVCQQRFPAIEITEPFECRDVSQRCGDALRKCLAGGMQVDGIYNTGAGNAGIAAALGEHMPKAWIAHELTPVNLGLLTSHGITAVLDQNPELQADVCLKWLLHRNGVLADAPNPHVPFQVITPENLPV